MCDTGFVVISCIQTSDVTLTRLAGQEGRQLVCQMGGEVWLEAADVFNDAIASKDEEICV